MTNESDVLKRIRARNAETDAWLVVLDDDPTGSQCVHDVTVLVDPMTDDLKREADMRRTTFIWTNTRSMAAQDAAGVVRASVRAALDAAASAGVRPVFVSRSDSTLRGHFGPELDTLSSACADAGRPLDGVVFAPAFPEAGRITRDDVQWVIGPDGTTSPAAETEYARDASFGYTEKDLRAWVSAHTGMNPHDVGTIPLTTLRDGGAAAHLLRPAAVTIANAATATDLDQLALACQDAERPGRRLAYRSGPSLVRALVGQPARAPLSTADLAGDADLTGLTVVGSHTATTNDQLDHATRRHDLTTIELDVDAVLDPRRKGTAVDRAGTALERALPDGHAALVTSRTVRAAPDRQDALAIARQVSAAVCATVRRVAASAPLGYVVAKGGITSHDVASRGLGVRRATVLGQVFPGSVSVLRLGAETSRPGIPYVVFPGNVGAADALTQVLSTLTGKGTPQ